MKTTEKYLFGMLIIGLILSIYLLLCAISSGYNGVIIYEGTLCVYKNKPGNLTQGHCIGSNPIKI